MTDLAAAFAQVAGAVGAAFGGPFAAGLLLYDGEPVYDDGGSIVTPGEPFTMPCEIQVDVCTEAMRADADFLERDVRLLILGPAALTTVPRVSVTAGKFAGQTYELRSVARDPLAFGWECRGRAVVVVPDAA